MKSLLYTATWSALSFLLCAQSAVAAGVYYFGVYGPSWGPDGSFRVLSIYAAVIAVIVGVLTAFGLSLSERATFSTPLKTGVFLGVVSAAVLVLVQIVSPSQLASDLLPKMLGFTVFVVGLSVITGKRVGSVAS